MKLEKKKKESNKGSFKKKKNGLKNLSGKYAKPLSEFPHAILVYIHSAFPTCLHFKNIHLLTCVRSFVNLKVFGSGEYFSTAREWAWKRFLPGVHPNVIYKLVLGFKRFAFPRTLFPKTYMVRLLWSSDVLHRHMRYKFVHGAVSFGAKFLRRVLRLQPLANQFLLYRLPHVAEKGTGSVVVVMVVVSAQIHVQIQATVTVQRRGGERISPGACHLTQVIRPNVHFSR